MTTAADGFLGPEDELDEIETRPAVDRPLEAADGSELAGLRERREKAEGALYFDLEVPRMEPPVFVRYRPVPQKKIEKTLERTARMRTDDRTVITNAIVLAEACVGVFEVIDGREVSIDPDDRDGEWPKFDPQLAGLLGKPMLKKSNEVVRALYLTDGDVISTAQDLAGRSGYAQEQLERETSGN